MQIARLDPSDANEVVRLMRGPDFMRSNSGKLRTPTVCAVNLGDKYFVTVEDEAMNVKYEWISVERKEFFHVFRMGEELKVKI